MQTRQGIVSIGSGPMLPGNKQEPTCSESALRCNDTKTALRCCRTAGCCYDSGHFQGRLIKSLEKKKKKAGEEQKKEMQR